MRWLPPLIVALVLLPGCAEPAAEEPEPDVPADDEPRRTARGGAGSADGDEEEREVRPVELLRTPLTFVGQGPESFDLEVPPGVVAVGFEFSGGMAFQQSGMRIELSDCGTYGTGTGISGSMGLGGGYYADTLCREAMPGPATVTISATAMVFDGTFTLTGFVPMDAATGGGNATANR